MSETLTVSPAPIGQLIANGTTYLVYTAESTVLRSRPILCVLESPKGARYLIVDNGAKYRLTAWNLGTDASKKCSPNRFVMYTPFDRFPLRRDDVLAAIGTEG